jgi:phosphoenolpyruvate carboxylase
MKPPQKPQLRSEIRWLGETLGEVIKEQAGQSAFDLVEEVRALARARREGEAEAEGQLIQTIRKLDTEQLESLICALSVFFDLANLAEDRERVRVVRERTRQDSHTESENLRDVIQELRARDVDSETVQALLRDTEVEFVFTAHPTEAKRRSVREKVRDLRQHLYALDEPELLSSERDQLERWVKADLTGLWQTDFVRFRRPSVLEELDRSLFFAGNLWMVVPRLFRELRAALNHSYPDQDFDLSPVIRFGTWIGGDRDGNPYVTAEVTEQALGRLREEALTRHVERAVAARRSLSMSGRKAGVSDELLDAMDHVVERFPSVEPAITHLSEAEPYRRWLRIVQWRLERALERDPAGAYGEPAEFLEDLRRMKRSLEENEGALLADAHLADWIVQAEVFGFSLMRLDIRQESSWYHDVIAEILARLEIEEDYGALDEEGRQRVLTESMPCDLEINCDVLSEKASETVALFRLLASVSQMTGPGVFGAHVVSMTHRPSDLLVVLWLSRWAAARAGLPGARLPIPIVPLFETIDDLAGADATLEALLGHPAYRAHLEATGGRQIVMIGYSDSTKDGGYMAASWGLFEAQARMHRAARSHGVELIFFHGRGGALGRGGGPAARHIRSLPASTMNAGLRITEQGEVLSERYDDPRIASRHLGKVLSAVLDRGAAGRVAAAPEEGESPASGTTARSGIPNDLLEGLAATSREVYRELVEHPGFMQYFEEATPIRGIEDLPIGSRPARRTPDRSLKTLRAIPWVFSWNQSRHMLPAWYGLGTALESARDESGGIPALREFYRSSGFFRATIDNAALALARADMGIARVHSRMVRDPEVREEIWRRISAEYDRTRDGVLELTGHEALLDDTPWLQRSIAVRNPYVDPLNLIQVELFRRLRELRESEPDEGATQPEDELRGLIRLTIQGIAGGLRTTG